RAGLSYARFSSSLCWGSQCCEALFQSFNFHRLGSNLRVHIAQLLAHSRGGTTRGIEFLLRRFKEPCPPTVQFFERQTVALADLFKSDPSLKHLEDQRDFAFPVPSARVLLRWPPCERFEQSDRLLSTGRTQLWIP